MRRVVLLALLAIALPSAAVATSIDSASAEIWERLQVLPEALRREIL
jgi:hypothetical protein